MVSSEPWKGSLVSSGTYLVNLPKPFTGNPNKNVVEATFFDAIDASTDAGKDHAAGLHFSGSAYRKENMS